MKAKYDEIGKGYNLTRKPDPYLTSRLLALLEPKKGKIYLDIGCGTGNYTREFHSAGYSFIGIDPSEQMLQKARTQCPEIDWRQGTAEKTGLPAASVDSIMASLTIHHWKDLDSAFTELYRVCISGGKIVVFTSTPAQMRGYWLNHYFPKMLADSIVQMPASEAVGTALNTAGFNLLQTEKYFIQPDLQDKFLYCGKQNPELYFDENIRQGISSFSSLAHQEEVKNGLQKLRQDIDSGKIEQIMKMFENEEGDYLFVVGGKNDL